ncbi:MAG: hypothetical protein ABIH65_04155 [Nanoarchaeota archaeon]
MELPKSILKVNEFFSLDKSPIGSFERLKSINNYFVNEPNFCYLIAGSWAIEGISGEKLEHDDIDLIILCNPPFYVDDAITKEEHCCNIIPLPLDYIKRNAVRIKLRERLNVLVPNLNLQFCLKLIGQLERNLPERAIFQTYRLLSLYRKSDYNDIRKEFIFLLKKLTPADFEIEDVAEKMILAIKSFKTKDLKDTEAYLKSAHKKINISLHKKFNEMNLE